MTTRTTVIALVCGFASVPVFAQRTITHVPRPEAVLRRCVVQTERSAAWTIRQMHVKTNRCVATVTELIAAGETYQAARVAEQCTNSINERANTGVRDVEQLAGDCAILLTRFGAPDEAFAALRGATTAATDRIGDNRQMLAARIRNALHSGGGQ